MFPALVKQYLLTLRAGVAERRRGAAGHGGLRDRLRAPEPQSVVNDLQYALRDADPGVRINAVAACALRHAGTRVEATWFIEMLNSLSWTDRMRALGALQTLTDLRGKAAGPDQKAVLDQIRTRALPALVEMARWKTLEHALPAYLLLGRVAGIPEQQVQDAWSRGDRESIIAQALKRYVGRAGG